MVFDFANAKNMVFWDVEDFPLPEGRDLRWFNGIIKEAMSKVGCTNGDISIRAYGKPKSPEELRPYEEAGITYITKNDKYWRLCALLTDMAFETDGFQRPPFNCYKNFMVIAANTRDETTEFSAFLKNLTAVHFKVVLVVPEDCDSIPNINAAWRWESFIEGGPSLEGPELKELKLRGYKPMSKYVPCKPGCLDCKLMADWEAKNTNKTCSGCAPTS